MPGISSETLFHFTNKYNLLGILENEFYPRFRLEAYSYQNMSFKLGIPMVCFCDIPLSLVREHMSLYGHYGIGMSKEWAEEKGLNPVLYLYKDSAITILIHDLLDETTKEVLNLREKGVNVKSLTNWRDMLFKLFRFTKPYDGLLKKIDGTTEYKKFYDEREWRYVPELSPSVNASIMLGENEFREPLVSQENRKVEKAKLTFEPSDINYIIIENESERLDLINSIFMIKEKYKKDIKSVLASKIITASQIEKDF